MRHGNGDGKLSIFYNSHSLISVNIQLLEKDLKIIHFR